MPNKAKHPAPDFETVLQQHRGIIFKVARLYTRNEADFEDLVQDISIQIWQSLGNYKPAYALSTWLYRIALNVSIDRLRREERRQRHQEVFEALPHTRQPGQPSGRSEQLHRWVQALPPLERALMLLYLEDYPHEEIGEMLGISKSNVGTKISRLKQRLKKELK
ncbi:MAG: RNA polymerase sigma factor [Planctomycetota bacterium]